MICLLFSSFNKFIKLWKIAASFLLQLTKVFVKLDAKREKYLRLIILQIITDLNDLTTNLKFPFQKSSLLRYVVTLYLEVKDI